MQPSDEIKTRIDIVDLIRDYIPLRAAGVNFKANCPFHQEKSPSFMVSTDKQIWHCFGCGKGGDIFAFIMEIEGISFIEALRILAPKAGVTLKKVDAKANGARNQALDVVESSAKYYHKVLIDSQQAKWAREYLNKRGLNEETLDEWLLGYSPDSWDDLTNYLKSQGYNENEIFQAGMSIKKEGMGRYYNRFRDRVMFPISDVNGAIVAFTARVNPDKEDSEKMGKYVNSPQTVLYDKSKILFGLDKAKMAIKREELAIIVEGQMDVITAHQNGFKNVVASSGTALTKEQLILIKRYTNNIALAFDMDSAGQIAADRGIREALAEEMNIKVIVVPEGKDPDECIRKNKDEWAKAVKNAKPMMEYYFDKVFFDLNLDDIQDKREGARKALNMINLLANRIEKDYWLKRLSEIINIEEKVLRETLQANIKKNSNRQVAGIGIKKPVANEALSREEMLSQILLALLFKYQQFLNYAFDSITADYVFGQENKRFYKNLFLYYNEGNNSSEIEDKYNYFKDWLKIREIDENQLKLLNRLVLLADKDYYELETNGIKNEIVKVIKELKKIYLQNRLKEIEKLISEAEQEKEKDRADELLSEFQSLSQELREININ